MSENAAPAHAEEFKHMARTEDSMRSQRAEGMVELRKAKRVDQVRCNGLSEQLLVESCLFIAMQSESDADSHSVMNSVHISSCMHSIRPSSVATSESMTTTRRLSMCTVSPSPQPNRRCVAPRLYWIFIGDGAISHQ